MTGSSAFLSLLADEGVTHLFGNPGTTELPIMDALARQPTTGPAISYVLGLQESVVVAMADGFARASGQLTACNVHVAPGLGNAMGSLYNAHWVGSPIIVTAGQQEQGHGLTEPLLYGPLMPMAAPVSKWSVEVTRLADLPRIVRRAAKVATTPPTGPVFISLPGDVLNDREALELGRSSRVDTRSLPPPDLVEQLASRMLEAESPVIICGAELVAQDALEQAAGLALRLGAPVYQQTVPHGVHFPSTHPAFMGALSRSQAAVRKTLREHDLLIALGGDVLRMSVHSPTEPLPQDMPIVQLGQSDWEMAKNYPVELAVRADLRATLEALDSTLAARLSPSQAEQRAARVKAMEQHNWASRRENLIVELSERDEGPALDPDVVMLRIVENLPPQAIVVEEALVSGRSLLSLLPLRDRYGYFGLASGGIGFAIAGAIGIQLAQPSRPVTAIIGDGSAMYSIQALWTAAHLRLPITYVIANNRGYRIIKERLQAFHGNDNFIGMDFRDPPIDFASLANSMGVHGERVNTQDALVRALEAAHERGVSGGGPTLLDVSVNDGFS